MKRLFPLLCVVCLFLSGCSISKNPANISKNCYTLGMNVLNATDDYLNHKITAVVAAGKIQDICRTLSALPEEAGTQDHQVKNYCEILSYTIMVVADGDHINKKEIIHTRNYLATLLGEPYLELH